jgi:hypothetical protein
MTKLVYSQPSDWTLEEWRTYKRELERETGLDWKILKFWEWQPPHLYGYGMSIIYEMLPLWTLDQWRDYKDSVRKFYGWNRNMWQAVKSVGFQPITTAVSTPQSFSGVMAGICQGLGICPTSPDTGTTAPGGTRGGNEEGESNDGESSESAEAAPGCGDPGSDCESGPA